MESETALFGINTPKDFFHEIVIPQRDEFVSGNANKKTALLAIIVSYHFHEWVFGKKFKKKDFVSSFPQETKVSEALELARRIANGTKHDLKNVSTRSQTGFSSEFSAEFARPLNADDDTGKSWAVDDLIGTIVDFWMRQEQAGVF